MIERAAEPPGCKTGYGAIGPGAEGVGRQDGFSFCAARFLLIEWVLFSGVVGRIAAAVDMGRI